MILHFLLIEDHLQIHAGLKKEYIFIQSGVERFALLILEFHKIAEYLFIVVPIDICFNGVIFCILLIAIRVPI